METPYRKHIPSGQPAPEPPRLVIYKEPEPRWLTPRQELELIRTVQAVMPFVGFTAWAFLAMKGCK